MFFVTKNLEIISISGCVSLRPRAGSIAVKLANLEYIYLFLNFCFKLKFYSKSNLENTYQLNNFYEHPVICGSCHQLEKYWSKRQIVLGIFPCQFTNHIYSSRLYT